MLDDSDTKFTQQFRDILKTEGLRPKRLTPVSPNLNAFVERFIQTLKHECLDHFLIVSEKQLNFIARVYLDHYHRERPHQGLGNMPLSQSPPASGAGEIICQERLGGLLKHYERAAA